MRMRMMIPGQDSKEMTKKGYRHPAEIRKRMSDAQLKRFENDTVWNKNKDWSPEGRRNISEGMRRAWLEMSPEQRQKMCEHLRKVFPYNGNGK